MRNFNLYEASSFTTSGCGFIAGCRFVHQFHLFWKIQNSTHNIYWWNIALLTMYFLLENGDFLLPPEGFHGLETCPFLTILGIRTQHQKDPLAPLCACQVCAGSDGMDFFLSHIFIHPRMHKISPNFNILDTSENLYHKYSRKVGRMLTPLWSTVTCNQNAALYITPFENAKHFPTTSISRFPCSFGFW